MANLTTKYLGLELKNPIIVGSSGLSKNLGGIQKIQAAGAGAVVLKTLFELGIRKESDQLEDSSQQADIHTEAHDLVHDMNYEYKVQAYIDLIKEAKRDVDLPVIASINCYKPETWIDFAKRIETAGADAVEINLSYFNDSLKTTAQEIEDEQVNIVKSVIANTNIPVSVKIGPYYSAIANFVQRLSFVGVKGVIMFNRFYKVDIDLENYDFVAGERFSSPVEISSALRWIALLSNRIKCDLVGSSGIKTGEDVLKMILAGAQTVEVTSIFYENGISYISTLLNSMHSWLDEHGFEDLDLFRGRLNQEKLKSQKYWNRHQYIKILSGID